MKILVAHPEDSPLDRCWSRTKWDLVVDLGVAGSSLYNNWSSQLKCPVRSVNVDRSDSDSARLRDVMNFARGSVVDDCGLDWWELNSVFFYQQLEQVILLARAAQGWPDSVEITITRPCFQGSILRAMFGEPVRIAEPAAWSAAGARLKHYGRVLKNFSCAKVGEIVADKYDPEYSVRRRFAVKPEVTRGAVVLVPSAYANASKMVAAYARMAPEQEFLLVATRRSGSQFDAPANVRVASLASYAAGRRNEGEFQPLLAKWVALGEEVQDVPELRLFARVGGFRDFPRMLATGLAVRDAWRRVFDHHNISAVFSGDEGNPYVCIPMLLGIRRGIATIAVHHGALDGRLRWKSPSAEVLLAKTRMEADYLTRICGVKVDRLVLGGPERPSTGAAANRTARDVVVFSEPYEVYGGRTEAIYRDVLPALCRIARKEGRRVVLKLHPFESARDRQRLLKNVLQEDERATVEIVSGALTSDLLSSAWFAVTVQSTAATECTAAGIPCFLCEWLADRSLGYAQQFARFGAGLLLKTAEELATIPKLLMADSTSNPENLSWPLTPESLRILLAGVRELPAAAAAG